jgi:hypothetical protein
MVIQENGRITKKMGMDHIFTLMGKDMRVAGIKIRSKVMVPTNTRMVINIMDSGRMIIVMDMERCNTATMPLMKANGRRESSTVEDCLHLSKVIVIMANG